MAHLKGISRDYISLSIPRDENLRAAKCCLTEQRENLGKKRAEELELWTPQAVADSACN